MLAEKLALTVRGFRRITLGLSWFGGVGILILMLPTVMDVSYRYILGSSLLGMIEYSEIGIVFVVYLGLANAMRNGAHIATPLVTSRLPERAALLARMLGQLVLWLLVAYATWRTALSAIDAAEIREFRLGLISVPTWQARIAVAIGFGLLLVEVTIQIAQNVILLRRGTNGCAVGDDG